MEDELFSGESGLRRAGAASAAQAGDPPSLKFRRASIGYMNIFGADHRSNSPAEALA